MKQFLSPSVSVILFLLAIAFADYVASLFLEVEFKGDALYTVRISTPNGDVDMEPPVSFDQCKTIAGSDFKSITADITHITCVKVK